MAVFVGNVATLAKVNHLLAIIYCDNSSMTISGSGSHYGKHTFLLKGIGGHFSAPVSVALKLTVLSLAAVLVANVVTVVMGCPKLMLSFQLTALDFFVNWAKDWNNYMLCVQSELP